MATKIEKHLSTKQVNALVDLLLDRSDKPTGAMVKLALEELGLWEAAGEPSHSSIATWLRGGFKFQRHRREIKADSTAARILADAGNGGDLDEANRIMLQSLIFAQLRALKEGRIEEVDGEMLNTLATNVSRLAAQGQNERKLEAKQAAAKNTVEAARGLTAETRDQLRKELGLM